MVTDMRGARATPTIRSGSRDHRGHHLQRPQPSSREYWRRSLSTPARSAGFGMSYCLEQSIADQVHHQATCSARAYAGRDSAVERDQVTSVIQLTTCLSGLSGAVNVIPLRLLVRLEGVADSLDCRADMIRSEQRESPHRNILPTTALAYRTARCRPHRRAPHMYQS